MADDIAQKNGVLSTLSEFFNGTAAPAKEVTDPNLKRARRQIAPLVAMSIAEQEAAEKVFAGLATRRVSLSASTLKTAGEGIREIEAVYQALLREVGHHEELMAYLADMREEIMLEIAEIPKKVPKAYTAVEVAVPSKFFRATGLDSAVSGTRSYREIGDSGKR